MEAYDHDADGIMQFYDGPRSLMYLTESADFSLEADMNIKRLEASSLHDIWVVTCTAGKTQVHLSTPSQHYLNINMSQCDHHRLGLGFATCIRESSLHG